MFGRWRKGGAAHRAGEKEGNVHALGDEGIAYGFALPEDVVRADGTAKSAPGGAPEDPLDTEERRDRDRAPS